MQNGMYGHWADWSYYKTTAFSLNKNVCKHKNNAGLGHYIVAFLILTSLSNSFKNVCTTILD